MRRTARRKARDRFTVIERRRCETEAVPARPRVRSFTDYGSYRAALSTWLTTHGTSSPTYLEVRKNGAFHASHFGAGP